MKRLVICGTVGLASVLFATAMSRCLAADAPLNEAGKTEHVPPELPKIPDKTFTVSTAGSEKNITSALQSTIDEAAKAGGGVVEIPKGEYECGPIQLASHVNLHLDDGALVKMLPLDKYPGGTQEGRDFIRASALTDVAITGAGTIDGQGTPWWPFAKTTPGARRPRMIAMSGCNRVLIQDVHLKDSPMFHIAISGKSENVTVDHVNIRATPSTAKDNPSHNTDACDVTAHHVLVKNCDISVGDDNFTCSGGASDILITHNTYGYGHGVSIGSKTAGEISNITVEDCTFTNTEAGIRIKTDRDRGGHVHDLTYRNLTMTNVNVPILIYAAYAATDKKYRDLNNLTPEIAASYPSAEVGPRTPVYENIRFENITATAAPGKRAGLIWGLPESPVKNLVLENVQIKADKPFGIFDAKGVKLINNRIETPEGVNKLQTNNAEVDVQK